MAMHCLNLQLRLAPSDLSHSDATTGIPTASCLLLRKKLLTPLRRETRRAEQSHLQTHSASVLSALGSATMSQSNQDIPAESHCNGRA
eukprot:5282768-Amphidinium_carterae.1